MLKNAILAVSVLSIGSALPLAAQQSLTLGNGGVTAKSFPARLPVPTDGNVVVSVTCTAPWDCASVSGSIQAFGAPAVPVAPDPTRTAAGAKLSLAASQVPADRPANLVLADDAGHTAQVPLEKVAAPPVPAAALAAAPAAPAAENPFALPLSEALATDCSETAGQFRNERMYFSGDNLARFIVSPRGQVYFGAEPDSVDENDKVEVVVVADERLTPRLKVSRKSAFRAPGALNVVGAGTSVGFRTQSSGCQMLTTRVQNFAPGKGEVEITALTDKGGDQPTGSFDFGVNTLYSGALAFGAIRTELRDPAFGLVASGSDSLITRKEDGTARVLYVVTYTPFIWGKRDLEKRMPLHHHINPMVGATLTDLSRNAILGVSVDLFNSFYLNGGVHAGRIRRLNSESGLEEGSPFVGNSTQIPTVREWDADWFVGVTLDIRAAAQLIKSAVTATQGS